MHLQRLGATSKEGRARPEGAAGAEPACGAAMGHWSTESHQSCPRDSRDREQLLPCCPALLEPQLWHMDSQCQRHRFKGSENLLSWKRPNEDHPGSAQDTPTIPPWAESKPFLLCPHSEVEPVPAPVQFQVTQGSFRICVLTLQ